MTREELVIKLTDILTKGDELSTVVYAIMKDSSEMKLLNIINTEIEYIQRMFIESIQTTILDVSDQSLQLVSEADDRQNTIFEYDLEIPVGLAFLTVGLNDELPVFSFQTDDLINIDYMIIEIGTEEVQLKILKKLSTVEVFGRGGYLLWKSNMQLERFEDKVLRFTPKFDAIQLDENLIFMNLKLLERSHGFHTVIKKEAQLGIQMISEMNILDTTVGLTDLLSNVTFARKVLKIKNSPVITNQVPNSTIIEFTRTHPALAQKMKYSEDGNQIILETKLSKELFIKMLDDAYLTSELTKQFYESKAKDMVENEGEEEGESP